MGHRRRCRKGIACRRAGEGAHQKAPNVWPLVHVGIEEGSDLDEDESWGQRTGEMGTAQR